MAACADDARMRRARSASKTIKLLTPEAALHGHKKLTRYHLETYSATRQTNLDITSTSCVSPTASECDGRLITANLSEVWMIKLLTDLGIEFAYEPRIFRVDIYGTTKSSARPDLYLPALDAYIELSCCKENRTQTKRNIIAALAASYPERFGLVTADDFVGWSHQRPESARQMLAHIDELVVKTPAASEGAA